MILFWEPNVGLRAKPETVEAAISTIEGIITFNVFKIPMLV
ncbi:Uncharacterised protein [Legionella londiniensis]|nr:Uncharacterised protein [Legionella londiniensis]